VSHSLAWFPDPKRAATSLHKFAANNENRIYKLLRGIMDESADYKTILKYNVISSYNVSLFASVLIIHCRRKS
jgi:hypothetical protein